tara:strand:+ start:116 stop:355 length:240 start_codon:yes stop_codon:yes gene_type:complete
MTTITLSIPPELKKDMDDSKWVNWSEIAREAIKEKVSQLKLLKSLTSKSKLTEKDALDLGKKVKKAMHQRSKEEHPGAY